MNVIEICYQREINSIQSTSQDMFGFFLRSEDGALFGTHGPSSKAYQQLANSSKYSKFHILHSQLSLLSVH